MNREELKEYIPHREPMLLIDEVDIDDNRIAHAKYHVRGDEMFLKGHFPGAPVVPGVILCEIMAQSCALLTKEEVKGHLTFYTGIDNARFKGSVLPGDVVEVKAKLKSRKMNMFFCEAELYVRQKMCASGKLSFAIKSYQPPRADMLIRYKKYGTPQYNQKKDSGIKRDNALLKAKERINIGSDDKSVETFVKELIEKEIL